MRGFLATLLNLVGLAALMMVMVLTSTLAYRFALGLGATNQVASTLAVICGITQCVSCIAILKVVTVEDVE